jgi:hypothetical protein
MEELERRLARIPSDLYEYYWSIFESIDDNYKDYTMRALQIAAIALPMPLAAFQYIRQEVENHTYAIKQKLEVQSYDTGVESQDGESEVDLLSFFPQTISESDAEFKVNKWCRDLLEVNQRNEDWKNPHPSVLRGQVQFLHRTVKDFLLKQNMQDLFHKSSVCISSPRMAVCRMYLAYTKSCCATHEPDLPDKPSSLEVNTGEILRWAKLCETYDHSTPLDLLNELEMIRAVQYPRSSRVDPLESVLRLAVREDLLLYVETSGREVRAEPGILWTALFPRCKSGYLPTEFPQPCPENLAMIAKLLDKGCSPDDGWTTDGTRGNIERSVWQRLMGVLYGPQPGEHDHPESPERTSRLVNASHIVAFLLIHGADPDAKFQYRSSGQWIWSHTDDFLMHVFRDDRAKVDALRKEARKVRAAALAKDGGFFAGFMGWSA